ncbi:MAG: gamma-glutamyl-gamma-aminobutyrate hydrolase family protein [Clostridia bacterium]|nr:gamma-glutamyl-gamma-aminobutyrate hydrolase family protein [Clostridia bacterium]
MGFRRGAQMLGVISGGEVIQDIPTWFENQGVAYDYTHRNQKATPESYRDYAPHTVQVAKGSWLSDIVGTDTLTGCPSWHHQAIKNVDNTRLTVTGYTETNGIPMIEAIERTDKTFAMGLQFHPEAAVVKNLDGAANKGDYMDYETALSVFRYIVEKSWLTLPSWSKDAAAKIAIMDYIAAITDETSESYIPVADRVAVFDLDGTLMCETYPRCFEYMVFVDYVLNNPDYTPTDEVLAVAQEIVDTKWQEKPSGISTRQAAAAALAYAGMTPAELGDYVKGFMDSPAEGFTGMTRGEAFYLPMVELVDYLRDNDFTVYIVTATERNIVRAIVKDTLDIAPAYVIGTEYGYTATGQGDTADGDYTFKSTDKVVFDGNYYGENAKMSKVDAIVREIGQQPVLAFGNSSGDVAMCAYVVTNNPYPALSYIVLADDEAREWGDYESAQAKIAGYSAQGIGTISMRDDFATIYGDGVEKDASAAVQ